MTCILYSVIYGPTHPLLCACDHVQSPLIVTHGDDVRPIWVAINKYEKILSCIGAEISSYFLKWATWFGLRMIGSWGLDGKQSWHCLYVRMILSISLSIPGQYMVSLALCLVRTEPWCDSWSCRMWCRIMEGISTRHPWTMRLSS